MLTHIVDDEAVAVADQHVVKGLGGQRQHADTLEIRQSRKDDVPCGIGTVRGRKRL